MSRGMMPPEPSRPPTNAYTPYSSNYFVLGQRPLRVQLGLLRPPCNGRRLPMATAHTPEYFRIFKEHFDLIINEKYFGQQKNLGLLSMYTFGLSRGLLRPIILQSLTKRIFADAPSQPLRSPEVDEEFDDELLPRWFDQVVIALRHMLSMKLSLTINFVRHKDRPFLGSMVLTR